MFYYSLEQRIRNCLTGLFGHDVAIYPRFVYVAPVSESATSPKKIRFSFPLHGKVEVFVRASSLLPSGRAVISMQKLSADEIQWYSLPAANGHVWPTQPLGINI